MEITISLKDPAQFTGDVVVFIVRQPEGDDAIACTNNHVFEYLQRVRALDDFNAKEGMIVSYYPDLVRDETAPKAKRVLAVGLGKEEPDKEIFRECGGTIGLFAQKVKAEKIMVVIPWEIDLADQAIAESLVEGIILGQYRFDKYKTVKEEGEHSAKLCQLVLQVTKKKDSVRKGALSGKQTATAACLARDMANEPGNYWTPTHFASLSLDLAKQFGFKRTVYGLTDLKRLKMGGIVGVNKGSNEHPNLILLEYRTGKKVPCLMLVGKGLTFDSGGISLKPNSGMQNMKYDMCGGAAIMGVMSAIGEMQPKNIDVVGVVPATDNMPGPAALKPGDLIHHYNGKTVEVLNTDAEGRLILADALAYGIKRYNPDAVVDLATLTGAVIAGLGHHRTGLMSNNDALANALIKAGEQSGEPLWRLPLDKAYTKQLKSKVADLKNISDQGAGTIIGGAFLKEFVGDTPWAHLDIAGTAWDFTEKSYIPKGPSGTGVRTLLELIRSWKIDS